MPLNFLEKWLQAIGQYLGIGTFLIELASEMGGVGFLIYRLVQMKEYKCDFKSQLYKEYITDTGKHQSYYMICEDSNIKDISLDQCHEYKDKASIEAAVEFMNSFSETHLLYLGIVWAILILLIIFFKCRYHIDKENQQFFINEKIEKNNVVGFEFLLSAIIGSLIIPITGINYQDKCGQNYFSFWVFSPTFVYNATYLFLGIGFLVYIIIANGRQINPIWSVFLLPYCFALCLFKDIRYDRNLSRQEKETEEQKLYARSFIALTVGLLYTACVVYCMASFVLNSHIAMTVFVFLNLVSCIFSVYQEEEEIYNYYHRSQVVPERVQTEEELGTQQRNRASRSENQQSDNQSEQQSSQN